ncbi:MAG: alpha-2-macroglobulin, partial [Prevotella sp.]|nr:alpha-2-macroglobulin [Prevotella sp.]
MTFCITIPMTMNGQTFASLWKQVGEAVDNDLPKTEQELLRQIAQKAEAEGDYAQLLKAELQEARSLCSVSPDSLPAAVERLAERERQANDSVLKAVYDAVLGYVYTNNNQLDEDNHIQTGTDYYTRALAHPDMLAATKTSAYETIINKGNDSKFFDDDLLSVIGYEAQRFDILSDYYTKSGNRRAALLSTLQLLRQQRPAEMERLNKSEYLHRVDSLIEQYADLPEAGEAAIERYEYMQRQTDATAAQKMIYLNDAITRWGTWQRMNRLRNAQRELTAQQFVAELPAKVITPRQQQTMKLFGLRGINALTMNIYRVDADASETFNPDDNADLVKLKKLMTLMPELTQTRTYIGKAEYEVYEDSMLLPGLPVGVYLVELSSNPSTQVSRRMLYVSDVRVISQPMPEHKVRFVVVNATTGQPIAKARLEITSHTGYYSDKKEYTLTTDANGECIYTQREKENSYSVYAKTADDPYCPRVYENGRYYCPNISDKTSHSASVYTDRQLYRPGQTVHAAAIFYSTEHGYQNQVEPGLKTSFVLRDANGQEVAQKEVTTDEYGTCHADLVIPTKGLTGTFTVLAGSHSTSITVEEYKRPAFEVDIPQVKMSYEDGDTVEVKGTARSYAGAPVPGAKVKYKVVRKRAFWWMSYSRYWNQAWIGEGSDDLELNAGETTTDARGAFTVDVPIVVPKTRYPMFYNFVVLADVTDQAGETHQGTVSLPMGNRPRAFSCDMPEKVLNDKETKLSFHQQNAAGVELDATVRYRFDNSGEWQQASTNKLLPMPKMKSGRHSLQAICEGDTIDRKFVVFALDDKRPAEETDDWFYISDTQFPYDGTPVTLQIGSSDKDVHVVYAIYSKDQVVESGTVELDGELLNRKLNYDESYGNGLFLSFAWVKNGVVHTHNAAVRRPVPDKNLKLTWKTFRNRLQPGQQEEWTLTVMAPTLSGKTEEWVPADAQLMATLYDKSLDQIKPHDWTLSPSEWLWLPSTSWLYERPDNITFNGYAHQGWLSFRDLDLSDFDHSLYPDRWVFRRRYRSRSAEKFKEGNFALAEAPVMAEAMVFDAVERMPSFDATAADNEAEETADNGKGQQAQVRENLSETAFFYPQLTTDSTGCVAIKFTLPESLTTWRFMGVAHTRSMMHGTLFDEAVASKDVMIQPNMPRLVRQGDRATIAARVINLGDNAISGTARLVLLDAETEKVVAQAAQPVSLTADSTVAVTFPVEPQEKWPALVIARVTIEAKATTHAGHHFSDGEQHYLPVLPAREHVTVTVPFTQNKPGTKTIDLQQLIPQDATQAKLTIEYTNNPAWLMVQALPSIGHPDDDCALCQAASLYANAIGMNIIGQNPQAKDVFEQWTKEEESDAQRTLNSQLRKNEELKDLILGETPWVLDADKETEQRQRLADFFDTDMMDKRMDDAFAKIKKLQNPDGSWSWWPGMKGSWYMTVSISQMFVRLNTIIGQPKA